MQLQLLPISSLLMNKILFFSQIYIRKWAKVSLICDKSIIENSRLSNVHDFLISIFFFFCFFPPNRNLSNNLSWGWLIGVIQNTELSPPKENESTIFPRLLTPSDTARNNYQKTPHHNPDPPVKITFFSAKAQVPHQIDKISSNSGHYLRRTWISFSNDSSFPSNPHRSIHLMATNFPLSDLSSASTTSEKAPLKDTNSINIIWYIWEYKK